MNVPICQSPVYVYWCTVPLLLLSLSTEGAIAQTSTEEPRYLTPPTEITQDAPQADPEPNVFPAVPEDEIPLVVPEDNSPLTAPLPTPSNPEDLEQFLEDLDTSAPTAAPSTFPPDSSPLTDFPTTFNNDLSAYILGPGDQIGISVTGFAELERNRIILPDGTILLPLIGPVVAAGKTLNDLEIEITDRLSFYLIEPVVELNLAVLRPVVVTVGGEVNRPGPVQLNSLSTFNTFVSANAQLTSGSTSPTISTALVGAGGVLRTADLRDVTVFRKLPYDETVTFRVNLWESIFQGGGGDNILLQDGDVVFVPKAPPESELDPQLVARSSLAPDFVRVRVIGEVAQPGEVQIPPDGSVSGAIAIAGGHDVETADLGNVTLLRLQENGQVEEQVLDLNNLVDSTPIQDGDVVVVPKRGFLNTLDNISRVLSPITAPFNFILLLDRIFN
jgi:polysaccharide export outer membrane protein